MREAVIDTPSGARMPLGDVATLEMAPTPNEIKRENASLRIDVTFNVAGSNLGRMAREVQERVQALNFEPGYHPEFLGQYAMRQTARDHLGWLAAASLLGTIVLLHLDFRSLRLMLLVVLTPPFALIGCVVSTFVGGEGLSVGPLVAFVTVLGIAARNGILLLSLYRHLSNGRAKTLALIWEYGGRKNVWRQSSCRRPVPRSRFCYWFSRGNAPGQDIEYSHAYPVYTQDHNL